MDKNNDRRPILSLWAMGDLVSGVSGDGGGGREVSAGGAHKPSFRVLMGAEPKALEAGPYFLSWAA